MTQTDPQPFKTKGKTNAEIVENFTGRMIDLMESEGSLIWQRDWNLMGGWPTNLATGKPYKGSNIFWLLMLQSARSYSTSYWLGFGQAKELAVKAARKAGRNIVQAQGKRGAYYWDKDQDCLFTDGVKKGEKATDIVKWTPFVAKKCDTAKTLKSKALMTHADNCEECRIGWRVNFLKVFNLDQTTLEAPEVPKLDFEPIDFAQKVVDGFFASEGAPSLEHGGDRASYAPKSDTIRMPERENFKTVPGYYITLFHEMGHSTGHESRLDREEITTMSHFGADRYCQEELVAEMTAGFLGAYCGIPGEDFERNTAAYLKGWIEKLREEPGILLTAATKAQTAMGYIITKALGAEAEGEETEAA